MDAKQANEIAHFLDRVSVTGFTEAKRYIATLQYLLDAINQSQEYEKLKEEHARLQSESKSFTEPLA